jgi:hypothetical protein
LEVAEERQKNLLDDLFSILKRQSSRRGLRNCSKRWMTSHSLSEGFAEDPVPAEAGKGSSRIASVGGISGSPRYIYSFLHIICSRFFRPMVGHTGRIPQKRLNRTTVKGIFKRRQSKGTNMQRAHSLARRISAHPKSNQTRKAYSCLRD